MINTCYIIIIFHKYVTRQYDTVIGNVKLHPHLLLLDTDTKLLFFPTRTL